MYSHRGSYQLEEEKEEECGQAEIGEGYYSPRDGPSWLSQSSAASGDWRPRRIKIEVAPDLARSQHHSPGGGKMHFVTSAACIGLHTLPYHTSSRYIPLANSAYA